MKTLLASLLLALTLSTTQADFVTNPILSWPDLVEDVNAQLQWEFPEDWRQIAVDVDYISPTQTEIDEMVAFAVAHKEFAPYVEEAWDCDNFANEFKYWADVWSLRHFRSRLAVTVGVAYIQMEGDVSEFIPGEDALPLVYHALIVIRRNDGQWFFYEPQSKGNRFAPIEGLLCAGSVKVLRVNF